MSTNYKSTKGFNCQNPTFSMINNYPVLTKAETEELWNKYHENGDMEAKERLILCNLRLVAKNVKSFIGRGVDAEDLFESGCIGLVRGIEKWDASKGSFTTVCTTWIYKELCEAVKDGRLISLPGHVQEAASMIMHTKDAFMADHGREATDEEVAKILGGKFTPKFIEDIREIYHNNKVDSLDREVFEDTPMSEITAGKVDDDNEDYDEKVIKIVKSLKPEQAYAMLKNNGLLEKYKSFINGDITTFEVMGNTTIDKYEKGAFRSARKIDFDDEEDDMNE